MRFESGRHRKAYLKGPYGKDVCLEAGESPLLGVSIDATVVSHKEPTQHTENQR